MLQTAKQFVPEKQIDSAICELEKVLHEAGSTIERLGRLKTVLVAEVEQLRADRESLKIYTEEEAAALLKLEKKHLAELRRTLNLPHLSFGNKPRYRKEHLIRIFSMLEVGPSSQGRMKVMKFI